MDEFSDKRIFPTPEVQIQISAGQETRRRCSAPERSHLDYKQVGNLYCVLNMTVNGGYDLTCQALSCLCVDVGDLRVSKVI